MKILTIVSVFVMITWNSVAQDVLRLKLDVPLVDLQSNIEIPHKYPSMIQALEWSNDFYEIGFFGIDVLGDWIFQTDAGKNSWKKFGNSAFKYAAGLAFSKFGSELPVPLGVWAHEEFHRSVLGVRGISSNNGNWIFDRWDGTVYGLSDETLAGLKANENENLLYSYISGVQYEILLNEKITLNDFYERRNFPKAALVLYNAWYVWDYFRFSASSDSDSAKVLAPPHEDGDPMQRDYAGSDINSWIYDMFNPALPYSRDLFPEGDGFNRRLGYSDLSTEEQDYLENQKKLSLLNFLNPAIFFINRINVSDDLSFNFFMRYSPTHFGNDIALFVPVKFRQAGFLVNFHRYAGRTTSGPGLGLGFYEIELPGRLSLDMRADFWNQPDSFFLEEKVTGGAIRIKPSYSFTENFSGYFQLTGKSKGWLIGNPYLDANFSVQAGISWNLND